MSPPQPKKQNPKHPHVNRALSPYPPLSLAALTLALFSINGCGGGGGGGGGSSNGGDQNSDTTPPSLHPGGNALSISSDAKTFTVTLSESINPDSLVKSKILVLQSGTTNPLPIERVSSSKNSVTIVLTKAADTNKKYYVQFKQGALKDLADNQNNLFFTETDLANRLDSSPPSLINPTNALSISSDAKVFTVTLSENIDPDSLVQEKIIVQRQGIIGNLKIQSVSSNKNILTITLSQPADQNGFYFVSLKTGAFQDLSGNQNENLSTEIDKISPTTSPPSNIPALSLLGGVSDTLTKYSTPQIIIKNGRAGHTVNIYTNNVKIASKKINDSQIPTTIFLETPLSNGTHVLTAKFQNQYGESVLSSPAFTFTVDNTPPALTSDGKNLLISSDNKSLIVVFSEHVNTINLSLVSFVQFETSLSFAISHHTKNNHTVTFTLENPIQKKGVYLVKLAPGAVSDNAGNKNTVTLSTEIQNIQSVSKNPNPDDTTPPSLNKSIAPVFDKKSPQVFTLTFSENINSIDTSKIFIQKKISSGDAPFLPIRNIHAEGSLVFVSLTEAISRIGNYHFIFNAGAVSDNAGNTNIQETTNAFTISSDDFLEPLQLKKDPENGALVVDLTLRSLSVSFNHNISIENSQGIKVYTENNLNSKLGSGTLLLSTFASVQNNILKIQLFEDVSKGGRFRVSFDKKSLKVKNYESFLEQNVHTEIDIITIKKPTFFISAINDTLLRDAKPIIPKGSPQNPITLKITGLSDSTVAIHIKDQILEIGHGYISLGETSTSISLAKPLPIGTVTLQVTAYNKGTPYSSSLTVEVDDAATIVTPSFDALPEPYEDFLLGTSFDSHLNNIA
jgi:hypothetical protein